MCGRFAQTAPPETLVQLFKLVEGVCITPRFNLAPTQPIVTIRETGVGRIATHHRWGFVPPWSADLKQGARLINARAETIFEKRTFAQAARHSRCVIPASGFYEWQPSPTGKQPTLFTPQEAEIFRFAGLWSTWADTQGTVVYTATILTTTPNETMRPYHHRMPVILDAVGTEQWLDTHQTSAQQIQPLLVPAPDNAITHRRVSQRVNSVHNDDPQCMAPLEHPTEEPQC